MYRGDDQGGGVATTTSEAEGGGGPWGFEGLPSTKLAA